MPRRTARSLMLNDDAVARRPHLQFQISTGGAEVATGGLETTQNRRGSHSLATPTWELTGRVWVRSPSVPILITSRRLSPQIPKI